MTQQEFAGWWANLKTRFPSVRAWIAKHAPNPDSQQAMLKTWREVMADAPHAEAMLVLSRMQAGDLPWLAEFEPIDRLPQHVRRLARQMAWEAIHGKDEPTEAPPRPSDFPAGKILVRIQQLVADGVSYEEAREQALKDFPIGKSGGREPRYHCHLCLDVQVIEIAHPAGIRAMIEGRFDKCQHRIGVVRCRCNNRQQPPLQFDPAQDFKIEDHLWRPAEVERLRAWVEFKRERGHEARAQSSPNYRPELAGFNRE